MRRRKKQYIGQVWLSLNEENHEAHTTACYKTIVSSPTSPPQVAVLSAPCPAQPPARPPAGGPHCPPEGHRLLKERQGVQQEGHPSHQHQSQAQAQDIRPKKEILQLEFGHNLLEQETINMSRTLTSMQESHFRFFRIMKLLQKHDN